MSNFPKFKVDDYPKLFIEETDKELPKKIDPNLRYAYFKTIAKGGKSLIQSCRDMHLNRVICYKSLLPEHADDPIEQKRLLREARVSAMLQHPNTMPTYELGRNKKGHYYFTMKLVHGYTLREVFNYRERYDINQLIDIIIQVAHALDYAHTHGVVHRDIKPENILVGPFGEVLLLDWGLAKVWSEDEGLKEIDSDFAEDQGSHTQKESTKDPSMTGFQKLQGTVSYMSPEQVKKSATLDHRSDIYSLGVILYEAVCGETVTNADMLNKALDQTLHKIPTPMSDILGTPVNKFLDEIIMKCLQKEPNNRIETASKLIRLLQMQSNWSA